MLCGHLTGHFAPEPAGIQYIGFVHTGDTAAPLFRNFHGHLNNAPDLVLGVGHNVGGNQFAVDFFCFVLPEIHAANQFAHHYEINAFLHDFSAQRACI